MHWCALPPCTLGKFPASDANPVHFPLAELSVPCVPSGTGNEDNRPKASSHKTTQAPDLLPGGPVCPVYAPGGGTTRPRPVRGRFRPHRAQFSRKKRKRPGPEKQSPAQTAHTPALGFPSSIWFPQKPAVVRGVKKQQVKGPGSPEASRAGSLRPAEPSVTGFFPGVNFPIFRGRFGCLGVMTGVRKAKFPGGKPFLRVSPPGSTKG